MVKALLQRTVYFINPSSSIHVLHRANTFPSTHPRVLFDGNEHSFFHPHIFGSEQVQVRLAILFRLTFLNPFDLCKTP